MKQVVRNREISQRGGGGSAGRETAAKPTERWLF